MEAVGAGDLLSMMTSFISSLVYFAHAPGN